MNKFRIRALLLITLVAFLLVPLYPVYALTTSEATISTTQRKTARERLEDRRDTFQENKEDFRENVATRAAAFKERLAKFRDKTKATIIEKINNFLAEINKRVTSGMDKHLKRLDGIIAKLEKRVEQAGSEDKDVTKAQQAIDDAKAKIETAKESVATQMEKDYTIELTQESAMRIDVKSKRDELHSDLDAAWKIVKDARGAVVSAIRTTASTLEGIRGGT